MTALTIDQALHAADALSLNPHSDERAGAWIATCPLCVMGTLKPRLSITCGEPEPGQSEGGMPARIHCGNGCDAAEVVRRFAAVVMDENAPARRLDTSRWVDETPPPVPWRVEGIVADGYVTMLAGRGGDSKSWLSLAWAIGVASGSSVGGCDCAKGNALIIDAENGEHELWRRWRLANGPRAGVAVYDADGLNLGEQSHADWLERLVESEDAQLVVLDGLRTLAPGLEENNGDSCAPIMANVRRLARRTQAAVVLLHHRGKDVAGYRGHSALRDQTDVLYVLERDRQDPERRTRRLLHADPARDGKMRLGPEPPDRWLHIDLAGGVLSIDLADPPSGADVGPSADELIAEAVLAILRSAAAPMSGAAVARALGKSKSDGTVRRTLDMLAVDRLAERTSSGWVARVASNPLATPHSAPERVAREEPPLKGRSLATPAERASGENDSHPLLATVYGDAP